MAQTLRLHNGADMPAIGFGTWGLKPGDVDAALRAAVGTGYRLFDLAPVYNNQREAGATLAALQAEGAVRRNELFLTSKVPPAEACEAGSLEQSARRTLRELQTPYLDLLLVHWPFCVRNGSPTWPPPMSYQLGYSQVQLRETWRSMERLQQGGLVRAIGLSNVGPSRLQALLRASDLHVHPAVIQAELHPYNTQAPLRRACAAAVPPIAVTAYASLGSGARPDKYQGASHPVLLADSALKRIAEEHQASVASLALAWAVRRGVAVIPKSSRPERVRANLAETCALAPRLTARQLLTIDGLNRNHAYLAQGWRGYAWRPGQSLGEIMGEITAEVQLGSPPSTPPPGGAAALCGWLFGGIVLALCTSVFCGSLTWPLGSPRRI